MKKILSLAALTLALGACGGGGSGSDAGTGADDDTVLGLEMPSAMDVVVADTGSTQPVAVNLRAVGALLAKAAVDAESDYSTDEQRKWVHDAALEPMGSVNSILCYMDQTRADELVNKTYYALVNEAKCDHEGEDQSTAGQDQSSSGDHGVTYNKWVVQSTRADNSSPQYVKIWAFDTGGGPEDPPMTIRAEMVVSEGVSDTNPYGRFVLNYAGVLQEDVSIPNGPSYPAGTKMMEGTLKTVDTINGKIGFTLYETSPLWGSENRVSVVADADMTAGVAFTGGRKDDGMGGTDEGAFALAFNPDNISVLHVPVMADLDSVAGMNGNQVESDPNGACLSRTDFKRNVWRYDLYDSTSGDRVQINSGFPFVYDGNYGWIGYWGIWSEQEPAGGWDGVTITKEQYGSTAAAETFTVSEAPGKLSKREKSELALTSLDGEVFHYNIWDNNTQTSTEYKVEYDSDGTVSDGANSNFANDGAGFYITHEVTWQQDGPPLETPVSGGPQIITFDQSGDDPWLGMWSQSLGGSVSYDSVNNPTNVTFYKETLVDANDSAFAGGDSITLNCYTNCLKPALTSAQYEDPWANDAYYPEAADGENPAPAAVYSFNKTTMALTVVSHPAFVDADSNAIAADAHAGQVVTLAGSYSPSGNNEPWGVDIGALIPTSATVLNKWDTWNQALSYRWETGHNSWNKVVLVTDDATGNPVSFDPPMVFSYQHAQANDANDGTAGAGTKFYGKTFLVEYAGNGDFRGIPWVEAGNRDWRPAFAIADGTEMGPTGSEYLIKAREMELKPAKAPGACGNLVLNAPAAGLPTVVDGDPSNLSQDAPTPTDDAPATIDGVVQAAS